MIKVEVVETFKLLGVTLDNKLNFLEHCSNLKKVINRKLFSIKRLFYLATSVKIHFFKTFILPYFDYCLSLIIYFPKSTFQSLNNCFNLCLYRLFKFKPEPINLDAEDSDEQIMNDFINKLQSYKLFTLQSRILTKLLSFTHNIINNRNAPIVLKESLVGNNNQSMNVPEATSELEIRNFRSGPKTKASIPTTKYDHLTFKFFFQKLLGTFKNFNFNIKIDAFKTQVDIEIKKYLKAFLKDFPKFNIPYSFFFKTKAKKKASKKAKDNLGKHNNLNDKCLKIINQKHVKKRKK